MWRWETKPVPVSSTSPFSISIPVFWCNPAFLLIQRDTCRSLVIFWPGRHRETLLLSKAKMKVYVHPFLLVCDATWVCLDSESWARTALPRPITDGALEKWVFPCLKLRLALGLMLAGIQCTSRVDKSVMVINNCHTHSRMFSYTFDPVLLFNPSPNTRPSFSFPRSGFLLQSVLWCLMADIPSSSCFWLGIYYSLAFLHCFYIFSHLILPTREQRWGSYFENCSLLRYKILKM